MRATELHATRRGGSAALLEVCCLRLMTMDDADDGWMQNGDFALLSATTTCIIRLDALVLSVIATATWLAGWLGGCLSQPVLYQND